MEVISQAGALAYRSYVTTVMYALSYLYAKITIVPVEGTSYKGFSYVHVRIIFDRPNLTKEIKQLLFFFCSMCSQRSYQHTHLIKLYSIKLFIYIFLLNNIRFAMQNNALIKRYVPLAAWSTP